MKASDATQIPIAGGNGYKLENLGFARKNGTLRLQIPGFTIRALRLILGCDVLVLKPDRAAPQAWSGN
jgi:hypothetical protein